MNCEHAREKISAMMDGELSPKEADLLRQHLDQCADCRRIREEWASYAGLMKARFIPAAQTPEAAWADVRRAIRLQAPEKKEPAPGGWVFGRPIQWASYALLLAVIMTGWLLMKRAPLHGGEVAEASRPSTEVLSVETELAGAGTMVYEDAESGWMVIWVVAGDKEADHAGT